MRNQKLNLSTSLISIKVKTLLILVCCAGSQQIFAQTPTTEGPTTVTIPALAVTTTTTLPSLGGQIPASAFAAGSEGDYTYEPTGKRDPFRPWSPPVPLSNNIDVGSDIFLPGEPLSPMVPGTSNGNSSGIPFERPAVDEEKFPLLAADVSEYKVVGIIWDTSMPRAVVKDKKGKAHTIFKKSRLGFNRGTVIAIREGEIVVTERSPESGAMVNRILNLSR